MYEALAGAALAAEDPDGVIETVARMRQRHPDLSREKLARKLTTRTALSCAAVGALASAPADLSYQAISLHELALSIARVSGRPATQLERAAAAAGSLLLAGAGQWLRRETIRATRRLPSQRAPLLPALVGALAGGAASFAAAQVLGFAARRFFFERRRRWPW